ncbi:MAG: tRNA(Ile)-lysidine synthetase-like protein, partial [Pedosphaera sp.]|nr:tRNA(Ile)-lysidine synthetase-like protein [Pedosphaera sp.]
LAGMKWQGPAAADAQIRLVRPLLDQPKSALAAYAKLMQVPFREDATNAQVEIQRNRIRHELLPLLRQNYQPALERVILRQMDIIGVESELVTQAAKAWLIAKRRTSFEALPLAVQRRCLQLQLIQLGLAVEFDLVEALRELANRPITVCHDVAVQRDTAGKVHVLKPGKVEFAPGLVKISLRGKSGDISFENARIHWEIAPMRDGTFRAPQQRVNFECFDAAKLGAGIVLRHWQPGDRFQPIGMASPVKLQNLFTNLKLPHAQRRQLLVGATAGGELFWVEGVRLGERFKLDKKTRYQLKWRWERL